MVWFGYVAKRRHWSMLRHNTTVLRLAPAAGPLHTTPCVHLLSPPATIWSIEAFVCFNYLLFANIHPLKSRAETTIYLQDHPVPWTVLCSCCCCRPNSTLIRTRGCCNLAETVRGSLWQGEKAPNLRHELHRSRCTLSEFTKRIK